MHKKLVSFLGADQERGLWYKIEFNINKNLWESRIIIIQFVAQTFDILCMSLETTWKAAIKFFLYSEDNISFNVRVLFIDTPCNENICITTQEQALKQHLMSFMII